jgi:peptidoglycan/xylan/chitin deacetylase (PgdA/CDA1 family)
MRLAAIGLASLCLHAGGGARPQVPPPAAATCAPPGPAGITVLPPAVATPWTDYAQGSRSRLAILLTDPDSRWLPLVHGLKAMGIPFVLVRDPAEALRHRVVLAYPTLVAPDPAAFTRFVAQGGTLVSLGGCPASLAPLFGAAEPAEPAELPRLGLTFNGNGRRLAELQDPREWQLRMGTSAGALGGVGWPALAGDAEPLAAYEDGTPAIVRRRSGAGVAYAFGMNFGTILYRGQSGRDEWFARAYVNSFEPTGDVFLRMVRAIYLQGEPGAVLLGTVPQGRHLSVLVTHDIDYAYSLPNAREFAEYERGLGIRATYFLQTKTVRDYLDTDFLRPSTLGQVRILATLGHELASHSVAHSPVFAKFAMGSGAERYPSYQPRVHDRRVTEGGSILGELRVSKYLIDSIHPTEQVVSFRPGYLANPFTLPEALAACGYRYVSSMTASGCLSHLPFRQNRTRLAGQELPLWEFPITLSDGNPHLMEDLPVARDLANQIGRYGGLFVLLIHPNDTTDKLDFEKALLPGLLDQAWFGTVRDFGDWWQARDGVGLDVALEPGGALVTLSLPEPVTGLVLQLPAGWSAAPNQPVQELAQGCYALTAPAGTLTLRFRRG